VLGDDLDALPESGVTAADQRGTGLVEELARFEPEIDARTRSTQARWRRRTPISPPPSTWR